VSSNVSDVFRKVLKLSSEVSECKPLPGGHPPIRTDWPELALPTVLPPSKNLVRPVHVAGKLPH